MIIKLFRVLTAATTLGTIGLLLIQCGGTGANPNSSSSSARTSWIPCQGVGDVICNLPVGFGQGKRPPCASSGSCGSDNFCHFVETPGTTCFPNDVAFCDWTPDGGFPQCNELNGGWPADAAVCGTQECVVSGTTCTWSSTCIQPAGQ
jgi:hypothetical protein